MKHPMQSLDIELKGIREILDQQVLFSFNAQERQSLREQAEKLTDKMTDIQEGSLIIGLLGGTGVGKSTLMNALAGKEIASTSHRRPHTDRVLIYRHEATGIPTALMEADVPWQEIAHQVNTIQPILLCDMPDFDSLLGEHRERVLQFLEHLDVLVWVTSPEKYGDGIFYEFLQLVPKARQNFSFVLNKGDTLFQGVNQDQGYEQLDRTRKRFQEHIRDNGVQEPLIYVLSSKEKLEDENLSPWNHFISFRQYVFQQRDIKQITAIKTANLNVEVRELRSAFNQEAMNLETFERVLGLALDDLNGQRAQWKQAAEETFGLWFDDRLKDVILQHQAKPDLLKGPGYAIAMLIGIRQNPPKAAEEGPLLSSQFALPEQIADNFERRLAWLTERLHHGILVQNLPAGFGEKVDRILDPPGIMAVLKERFSGVVASGLANLSQARLRGFLVLQTLTYLALFGALLLALGAETAWEGFLENPGVGSILRLFVSLIHTLFSGKGLAALGSYALLNVFFGFRLYRRYGRLIDRAAEKVMDALKASLLDIWKGTLDDLENDLKELRAGINTQISTLRGTSDST